jgi:hypothetical protein
MDFNENGPSSSINHFPTGTASIVEHTEPGTQVPSSTITLMTSDSSLSSSSVQSSKKKPLADDYSEFHYVSTRKQRASKGIPIGYLRHRLCVRELVFARL